MHDDDDFQRRMFYAIDDDWNALYVEKVRYYRLYLEYANIVANKLQGRVKGLTIKYNINDKGQFFENTLLKLEFKNITIPNN